MEVLLVALVEALVEAEVLAVAALVALEER
jgi:hypothetical protein